MQYFGSNFVESVAESWVEAEMSWVEVDEAGWSLVHGLVIPVTNTSPNTVAHKRKITRKARGSVLREPTRTYYIFKHVVDRMRS